MSIAWLPEERSRVVLTGCRIESREGLLRFSKLSALLSSRRPPRTTMVWN